MKTTITTIFAMSLLLFGCKNSTNESSKETTKPVAQQEKHEHAEESDSIALNNGVKWKVDENMMVHIHNMEKDVTTFEAKSVNDYSALAKKLTSNIDLLTANCTMEGQAHDELHKWLLPFIDLVKEFSESKSEQEFTTHFEKIKTTFIEFNKYFQ
ncbi:MAG: hypothetical protein KBD28_09030 [Chitinophagaceae bacterium]|jgi:hypothetical protein|nr:hypothetical protein [Chitinophagaceae bacterium]